MRCSIEEPVHEQGDAHDEKGDGLGCQGRYPSAQEAHDGGGHDLGDGQAALCAAERAALAG